jgi:Uma2 family endonuclease
MRSSTVLGARSWARQVAPRGPFRADQLRAGDPYELSQGHAIECLPVGARGERANLLGGAVLESDPAVEAAGVDTGFSPEPGTMRAPDIAVGNIPDAPGWVKGTPPLAVEYADIGQDEEDLLVKIEELFAAGTQMFWVVRLVGARRVEVHEPGKPMRTAGPGEVLEAPGILKNGVPVEALYSREAAHEVILRNLLQRRGIESLDALEEHGRQEGRREAEHGQRIEARAALGRVLARRGLAVSAELEARIEACSDLPTLRRWLEEAAVATSAAEALEG